MAYGLVEGSVPFCRGVDSEPLAVVTQFQVERDKRGRGKNKKWDWAKDCTQQFLNQMFWFEFWFDQIQNS